MIVLPQLQMSSSKDDCRQGGQGPRWSGSAQKWMPQPSRLLHVCIRKIPTIRLLHGARSTYDEKDSYQVARMPPLHVLLFQHIRIQSSSSASSPLTLLFRFLQRQTSTRKRTAYSSASMPSAMPHSRALDIAECFRSAGFNVSTINGALHIVRRLTTATEDSDLERAWWAGSNMALLEARMRAGASAGVVFTAYRIACRNGVGTVCSTR